MYVCAIFMNTFIPYNITNFINAIFLNSTFACEIKFNGFVLQDGS